MREAWPGAAAEVVPAWRKDTRSAPRAGIAMLIHPELEYNVRHVFNERDRESNGVIQAMKITIRGEMRMTGAYLSPTVTGTEMQPSLDEVIKEGVGGDLLIRDFNARHGSWDRAVNTKRRMTTTRIIGTNHRIFAPTGHTYSPRGRAGGSTQDIAMTNIRCTKVEKAPQGMWTEASDHEPIVCTTDGGVRETGNEVRRVLTLRLNNPGKVKEAGKEYVKMERKVIRWLEEAERETVQQVFGKTTEAFIGPWTSYQKLWTGDRPTYWTSQLEIKQQRQRSAYMRGRLQDIRETWKNMQG